uniref:GATA-type domain-containing protein n=1 Tax=Mantoniella antarctica TaxID=81844 RepID=A0A7S0SHU2_9CHLO|mmetsp:Transcript_24743/g.61686  ORF Transcript_24743/g.61686 Transcript_24743/m.61686 type:complete len:566 (+) Transcript_24743:228-1925(+)
MAKARASLQEDNFMYEPPQARHSATQMKYVAENLLAHVATGGISLMNVATLAEVARIKCNGRVVTLATRPEAAKLAYTDDANASKVHVVDLSGYSGSLGDVAAAASVGALEVPFAVKHLAFSLDGTLLLTVGASSATLWRWEDGVALQHNTFAADEVGVGAAFCPGLETPTFVVVGQTAARFVQLANIDDGEFSGERRLKTSRVTVPDRPGATVTSFCWSRRGLWLGLRCGALALARLENPASVAAVHMVSTDGCFGAGAAITQLESCPDGGCLVAINCGVRCYWVSADATVTAAVTLGHEACSVAVAPGAAAHRTNLFLVASLHTPGTFARVTACPAVGQTDLTRDVEYVNVNTVAAHDATGVVHIVRSAATLNQVPPLVEMQTLLNRVPSLKQIVRVPSLMELNARVSMPPAVPAAALAMPSLPLRPAPTTAVAAVSAVGFVNTARSQPSRPTSYAAAGCASGAAAAAGDTGEDGGLSPVPCPGKVCAHCHTMETPLWRYGPMGPKTLCNACGVRHTREEGITNRQARMRAHGVSVTPCHLSGGGGDGGASRPQRTTCSAVPS